MWYSAATALGRMGPGAASVAPELIAIARDTKADWNMRANACLALGAIRPVDDQSIAALIGVLNGGPDVLASCAVRSLAMIGRQAVAPLVAALGSDARTGSRAARTDLSPDFDANAAVPKLIVLCRGQDARAGDAAWALGKIGPAARDALPALMAALKRSRGSGNGWIIRSGCNAAVAIGGIGKPAVPLIAELKELGKAERHRRIAAAIATAIRMLDAAK
mgnify:CR=1 FL=1